MAPLALSRGKTFRPDDPADEGPSQKASKRKKAPWTKLGQLITHERKIAFSNDIFDVSGQDDAMTPLPSRSVSQAASTPGPGDVRPTSQITMASSRPTSRAATSTPFGAKSKSSMSTASGSIGFRNKVKRVFCGDSFDYNPGGWTLRYAEFSGTYPVPPVKQSPNAKARQSQREILRRAHKMNSKVDLLEDCHKNDEPSDEQEAPKKADRIHTRRNAIDCSAHFQSKLHVKSAIKIFSRNHMDKLCRLRHVLMDHTDTMDEEQEDEQKLLEELVQLTSLPEETLEEFIKLFKKYDLDSSGVLDKDEVRKAISDQGLQPTSQMERQEVNELLCEYDKDDSGEFSVKEFVLVVIAVRAKIKDMQMSDLHQKFVETDRDGSGELSIDEVEEILSAKGLTPRNDEESKILRKVVKEVDADNSGEVNFEEFLILMDKVRERITVSRRVEEQKIATDFGLSDGMLEEFRPELLSLKEIFDRYDKDQSGKLDHDEAMAVLTDSGLKPRNRMERQVLEDLMEDMDPQGEDFDFREFLIFMRTVRRMVREQKMEELWAMFAHYDNDHSGELGAAEINQVMEDLHLLPRTKAEQDEMKATIMEVDKDGSGKFDFDEFQVFMQKVRQKIDRLAREVERGIAQELGFADEQVQQFRKAFDTLDHEGQGELQIAEIRQVMRLLRQDMSSDDLREMFEELDEDGSGFLEFNEFLRFMRLVENKKEEQKKLAREMEQQLRKSTADPIDPKNIDEKRRQALRRINEEQEAVAAQQAQMHDSTPVVSF